MMTMSMIVIAMYNAMGFNGLSKSHSLIIKKRNLGGMNKHGFKKYNMLYAFVYLKSLYTDPK